MNRFSRLLFVVLLAPLSAVSGQNTPPPQLQPRPAGPANIASPPALSGPNRQIALDVQVTDKSGAPIRGLQKQDFTVLDDKQPRDIVSFQAVDSGTAAASAAPVEILLVVDAVNTSYQAVSYERGEIRKFLLRNGGVLAQPTALMIFSDDGVKVQNGSSRDGNALAAEYDRYETGLRTINRSSGFYGASERFSMSLKTVGSLAAYAGARPGRKLVIWISPGWPLLSGPGIEMSDKSRQQLFQSVVAASTELRQAGVTLYDVDPLGLADAGGVRIEYYKQFLKGVPSSSRVLPGNLGLQVLAVQSGGRVINSTNDLATAIVDCAADADAFYVLSFNSNPADQANEYHSLAVVVNKPGTAVRTRTGYYAQP